ncbi:uncharacterized protein LOC133853865 [Alnus glutinosa]|uniref:uncharacterized protein LOC133853865 n=1 Tax=Alnus glutinosa TaxID=3517 RepID=UPI002D795803|nr:uncharacterized protein LOC133853865 [Alnus glutinosa]
MFSSALNGSLVGYCEGRKGLRPGDPISLYLFVIAMEVFAKLLEEVALRSEFEFNPKCDAIKLMHLCFAHDVLTFSKASVQFVKAIHRILEEFTDISGLKVNHSKSSIFCSGVSVVEKRRLLECLNMPEGSLPARYLGVPLISKKFAASDCASLLEKIFGRINSGLSKNLPFMADFNFYPVC